jgi:hypothetical protein
MNKKVQKNYNISPQYIIGFHGCDKKTADKVICKQSELKPSKNKYDWLGHGQYFWENDYFRALEYATFLKVHPSISNEIISTPFVIGAIICMGNCLDLTKRESVLLLKKSYDIYKELTESTGFELAENKKGFPGDEDLLKRNLDCAVIEHLFSISGFQYDSVRGVF